MCLCAVKVYLRSWLQECIARQENAILVSKGEYSKVSFYDGPFYDDSLLRPLSSRTEHSRFAVHHCRNSSFLSVLSVLLVLLRCACVSSFSILVQFFQGNCHFFTHDVHQKEEKIKAVDVTFFLDVFWTTAWAFFSKIESDLIAFFSINCVIFYIPNSLN